MAETRLDATSVSIAGRLFVDSEGRVLDLRGANVSSSSKVPIQPAPKIDRHAESSYVGRPFPLDEADQHWQRLKSWGLTFIRINVTWEALEHAGPGKYDEEYLSYLRELLGGLSKHGLGAYVSMHQDVWSRYSGGSGAPGWTLEAAGFDLSNDGEKLALSGAAFLDGVRGGRLSGERGLWPTGYQKLACATMNTLFWAGKTFAPSFTTQGLDGEQVNIQDYLQEAFLRAVAKLSEAVGDLDPVIGIELMNEPHPGFIGLPTIQEWNYNTDLHLGRFPSPLQGFSLGAGHPTRVPHYVRSFPFPTRHSKNVLANETGANAWANGQCIWEREGVWRWSDQRKEGIALQDDYFTKDRSGNKVDFYNDCYFPFIKRWNERIAQTKGRGKMRMVMPVPNEFCPVWPESLRPDNFVYSPHWRVSQLYDLNALFKKQFGTMTVNVQGLSRVSYPPSLSQPEAQLMDQGMFILKALYFGREGAKKNYAVQIKNIVDASRKQLGEVPVIIGECGVPMDINNEEAMKSGNFEWQERMMDAIISAMESSMIGFNLWAYNPYNRDDTGDDWNAENFSWYSARNRERTSSHPVEKGGHDAGARLLDAIVRPYAIATAGTPLSISFDYPTSTYSYRFSSPARPGAADSTGEPPSSEVTELYIPARHYREGRFRHTVSSGGRIRFDFPNQRAYVWFVDSAPPQGGRPWSIDRVRRVDFWVPEKARGTGNITSQQIMWFIVIAIVGGVVALWAQYNEIQQDRMFGFTHSHWKIW